MPRRRVEPCAGTDVHDPGAGFDATPRERVADPSERFDRPIELIDDRVLVTKTTREWSSRVEMVGTVRVDGDLAILVADLRSQRVDINEKFVRQDHSSRSTATNRPIRSNVNVRRTHGISNTDGHRRDVRGVLANAPSDEVQRRSQRRRSVHGIRPRRRDHVPVIYAAG
jgi:hypothetical protein